MSEQNPSNFPRPEEPSGSIPPSRTVLIRQPASKPILTYTILVVTVLVYVIQMITESSLGQDLPLLFLSKYRPAILAGEYWRLLTPALVHGSILHLLFNMYALYILGRNLEAVFGHLRFGMLYLLGAFGGNALSFVLSDSVSVGASTAVFALVAAQAVFVWQNRKIFGAQARPMLINIVMVIVVNFSLGLARSGLIDNWGHLGGFIAGLVFSLMASPKWQVERLGEQLHLDDTRSTRDAWIAAVMVIIAFTAIVLIPFLT